MVPLEPLLPVDLYIFQAVPNVSNMDASRAGVGALLESGTGASTEKEATKDVVLRDIFIKDIF